MTANVLRYEFKELVATLLGLPHSGQVAFAAAAATRLFPMYVRYSERSGLGNAFALQQALRCVWEHLESGERAIDELTRYEALSNQLTDVAESPSPELDICAQSATAAITHTLRAAISKRADEAAMAAGSTFNAAYQIVLNQRLSGPEVASVETASNDVQSPLVQTELGRQQRDLEELRNADPAQLSVVLKRLHRRSETEVVLSSADLSA